jgi:hypothetical protein
MCVRNMFSPWSSPRSPIYERCPVKNTKAPDLSMPGPSLPSDYQAVPLAAPIEPEESVQRLPNVKIDEANDPPCSSRSPLRRWRWEIFTYLLGTSAFIAILVILLSAQHKPPQSWVLGSEYEIEITAIVAALAQTAQSAFLVPISYCIGQLKWCIAHPHNQVIKNPC